MAQPTQGTEKDLVVGHPDIARACRENLGDDEAMAGWLDKQLPKVVREAMRDRSGGH